MINLEEFKAKAYKTFPISNLFKPSGVDPTRFLYSLDWSYPQGPAFNEAELSEMNISLDLRSCFGRAVKAAVIASTFFPEKRFYSGEVLNDFFRIYLLQMATEQPSKWSDETFILDLLQYENPHIILVDEEGNQFDPLFKVFGPTGQNLRHPEIQKLGLWEALYAAYLISAANSSRFNRNDLASYKNLLELAQKACDGLLLTEENLASMEDLFKVGVGQVVKRLLKVSEDKKDARILFNLFLLTNDDVYKNEIVRQYDKRMFEFLTKIN